MHFLSKTLKKAGNVHKIEIRSLQTGAQDLKKKCNFIFRRYRVIKNRNPTLKGPFSTGFIYTHLT
jgi:hypothetical protein